MSNSDEAKTSVRACSSFVLAVPLSGGRYKIEDDRATATDLRIARGLSVLDTCHSTAINRTMRKAGRELPMSGPPELLVHDQLELTRFRVQPSCDFSGCSELVSELGRRQAAEG